MLTHRNLIANLLQCEAWLQPALHDTSRGPVPQQFVYVCALPLYHAFALVANCLFGMRVGALNVLIANPRDLHQVAKDLRRQPFNVLPAVNTLLNAMAENAEFRKLDFSGLRITIGAGMAVHKAVADKWLALTGCPIIEAYGLTETSPAATCNPILIREWSGTIGLPFPSTEIAILDDAGQPVPLGQPGEIAIRGPQVMAGYWQRPDETAKVMTPDGYFKSGDIGIMDERGHTRIVDRKKDMIIVSGFNVFPNEIEAVLALHPGVLECAVIRRARRTDRRGGQGVRRAQGSGAHGGGPDGVLPAAPHRLQEAEDHRVPRRSAEEQHRQDPAPRAQGFAGDGRGSERVTAAAFHSIAIRTRRSTDGCV